MKRNPQQQTQPEETSSKGFIPNIRSDLLGGHCNALWTGSRKSEPVPRFVHVSGVFQGSLSNVVLCCCVMGVETATQGSHANHSNEGKILSNTRTGGLLVSELRGRPRRLDALRAEIDLKLKHYPV